MSKISRFPGHLQLRRDRLDRRFVIEEWEQFQKPPCIQAGQRFPLGHFEQEVKVIAHQAVSDNPHPREGLELPQNAPEDLFFIRMKDNSPIHHPRNTMIESPAAQFDP